jgi:predicted TIM-barrel fold metal-dependent hydrolase
VSLTARSTAAATLAAAFLCTHAFADAALESRIAAALDAVAAIDNHTHLLEASPPYDPALETLMPILLRTTRPETLAALKSRYGVEWDGARGREIDSRVRKARAGLVASAGGEAQYWAAHLATTNTQVALVNQEHRTGTNGKTLLWVPYATTLGLPFPNEALAARHPEIAGELKTAIANNQALWKDHGLAEAPATLDGYLALLDRVLARYREQGAVALKFVDAYHRTIRFAEVPKRQAEAAYARARSRSASRAEYLAMQDYIYRHLFKRCGEMGMPAHIHSSHGAGPFLRLSDSDVRNLEEVLSDPAFFGTNFVLIHAGMPWHEAAAYLAAAKAHVWIDLSAMAFLYPVPEMAQVIRKHLTFAPERTLFGTDAMAMAPMGTEVNHAVLSTALRQALYKALAGMVGDGMLVEARAIEIGRGVLRDNARRLYALP